jgi:hypothetical protein
MSPETEKQPDIRKRDETLSKDGQWRSFPKIPCLLQYVSNGNYYGRIRVNGKLIRVSLKTTVWTGWRWRKRGSIKTVNIYGRLYVSAKSISDFIRRAESGEFAVNLKLGKRTAGEKMP